MTMTGDLLGTLRYMSPEQAEGKSAFLDHRTDIYSLGITLYELITLRPAFPAGDRQTLLKQISSDEPPAPRKLNNSIPADLETIILKCSAKDPHARYASAGHLADDLRRFLAQQPIRARRASLLDRGRRWISRHVPLVTTALLTLALVAASAIAATVFTLRAYQSEADERTKAEENLRLAAESIDQMLTRVAERRYTQGDMQFAESLAADATRLYEQLLRRSDDPELKVRAANALIQVAHIQIRLGEHEKAQQAYGRAAALLTPLTQASPERDDYLVTLAAVENGRGEAFISLGQHTDAEGPYRRALAIAEQLVKRLPANTTQQIHVADRLNNLGVVYTFTERLDEAEKCFERSSEIEEAFHPGNCDWLAALDRQTCLLLNWASLARERGEYDRAIELLEQSATGRGLVGAFSPGHPDKKLQSYNHYWNLAYTYVKAGRAEDAAATVEEMVNAYPDWLQANHEGAHLLLLAAEQCSRHAPRAVAQRLAVGGTPTKIPLPLGEGRVRGSDEESPRATGSASGAEAYRQRARELLAKALTASIRHSDTIDRLAWFLLTCSDESFRDPAAALELAQSVVKAVPKRSRAWYTLALALYRTGDLPAAEKAQQESIDLFGVANAYNCALTSMIRSKQGQGDDARKHYQNAQRLLTSEQKKDEDLLGLITEAGQLIEGGNVETKNRPGRSRLQADLSPAQVPPGAWSAHWERLLHDTADRIIEGVSQMKWLNPWRQNRPFPRRVAARRPFAVERLEDRRLLDVAFGSAFQISSTSGESAWDIAVDGAGNTAVLGFFRGTVDLDPGPGTYNLTSRQDANGAFLVDLFAAKYDAAGSIVWGRRMGAGPFNAGPGITPRITIGDDDAIFVSGAFKNTADFGAITLVTPGDSDAFLAKLDGDGNFLWARQFGGSKDDLANSVVVDGSGNAHLIAEVRTASSGNPDAFFAKLDPNGDVLWTKQVGASTGRGWARGFGITVDTAGNVYGTGIFRGSVDFDSGAGNSTFKTAGGLATSAFVLKVNANGDFVWAGTFDAGSNASCWSTDIGVDANGHVFTGGYFSGTVDFDPGKQKVALKGSSDTFVTKLSPAGSFIWARSTEAGYAEGLVLDSSGSVYVTGSFSDTADFDPGVGTFNLTSAGAEDAFIWKLDTAGNFVWAAAMRGTGSDKARGIDVDAAGNVYTTGSFAGTADFDPDAASEYNLTSDGTIDAFVWKLVQTASLAMIGSALESTETNSSPDATAEDFLLSSQDEATVSRKSRKPIVFN